MKKQKATFSYNEDMGEFDFPEYLTITTPYNPKFVDDLKQTIPSEDRVWVKDSKVWVVNAEYSYEIEEILQEYFEVEEV